MQIYANKLQAQLTQSLSNVYLIAGDDDLLRDDSVQLVRDAAKKNGFSDNQKFIQDSSFSWQQLLEASNAMSLFAEKRLLELKLSSSKIGTEGSQAVLDCLRTLDEDTVLLISAPRMEGKPKWLSGIIDQGIYVPIYPLDAPQLPGWLIQRAKSKQLQLSQAAAELLAERTEGNLVAAVQELDKLALLSDTSQTIDAELVETSVTDNARYSTFNMLDRAIDGDAKAACKALLKIREEGTEAIAIIGAVAYQLRNLLALAGYAKTRQLAQGFKAQRILPRRQKAVGAAVERLTMNELEQCVQLLGRADALYKSGQAQVCWMALEAVILSLAGKALNSNPVLASFRVY